MTDTLRVHHFEPYSYANGPGRRAVLWLQGCTLNCPGCFNPHTHSITGGKEIPLKRMVNQIIQTSSRIEGLTISGGEPLQQLKPLLFLLSEVRHKTTLSIILFSGYTFEEIRLMPAAEQLFSTIDVLIAGRYDPSLPTQNPWLGSGNKTVHFFTPRYSIKDLSIVPPAEVMIASNGEIISSGIAPVVL